MNYKGTYSDTLMYSPGDVVTWHGSSFVSLRMNQGVAPNTSGMWAMIAAAGSQGHPGADGRNGEPGRPGAGVAPGGAPGQVLAKIGDGDYETAWVNYGVEAIKAARSDHRHATTDVVGLSESLAAKAPLAHDHHVSQITGLDEKLNDRALMNHGHSANQIEGGELFVDVVDSPLIRTDSMSISDGVINSRNGVEHMVKDVPELIVRHQEVWVANTIDAGVVRIRAGAPLSNTAEGRPGEIRVSSTHLYVCIDSTSWKRIALQDW